MKRSNDKEENKHTKTKIIICIIIIIIIILLLLTSCTSGFWGRIGNFFNGESNINISDDIANKRIITNKQLKFESLKGGVSLDDDIYKLSFTKGNLGTNKFTCVTDDANIATCLAKEDYVEIYPKSEGETVVYVKTETNGYIYQGTYNLTITGSKRKIELAKNSGNIYLTRGNSINIPYYLRDIEGKVSVEVSDKDIATAKVNNGILTVTAKKTGKVTVTLSVEYKGKTYKTTYKLNVYKDTTTTTKKTTTKKTTTKKGETTKKTTTKKRETTKKTTKKTSANETKPTSTIVITTANSTTKKTTGKTSTSSGTTKKTTTSSTSGSTGTTTTKKTTTSSTSKKTTSSTSSSSGTTSTKKTSTSKTSSSTSSTTKKTTTSSTSTSTSTSTTSTTTTSTTVTKSNENRLNNIEVSVGELSPSFNSNKTNYTVNVDSETNNIKITATKKNAKEKIKYYIGEDVKSTSEVLNINTLPTGTTKVRIEVTAENGDVKNYNIDIVKAKSTNNNLSSLSVTDFNLNPNFDKTTKNYNVKVNYNTTSIKVNSSKEDSRSTVTYKVDGQTVENLNSVALTKADTVVEVIVTSEAGESKTYKVNVHKPTRKVEFAETTFTGLIEDAPFKIHYLVYEDEYQIEDYNKSDIIVNKGSFNGIVKVFKDYIEVTPADADINQTNNIELSYCNTTSNVSVSVKMKEYFMKSTSNTYDIDVIGNEGTRNIILNTNMLNEDLTSTNLSNGVKLAYNKANVTVTSNNSAVKVSYVKEDNTNATSYYSVKLSVDKNIDLTNPVTITIDSSIYGRYLTPVVITLKITKKYNVVIDADDGYYDSFTTKYEFIYPLDTVIDLSEYVPYKEADGNCMYYVLDYYLDQDDVHHAGDEVITVTKDITLTAKYKNTAEEVPVTETGVLYLTDVEIFKNDKYYEKYNIKDMIYPGVEGNYKIEFTNNTSSDIKITGINIEEDTICTEATKGKCLNMGYILKHDDTAAHYKFLYGGDNSFAIVSTDSGTTIGTGALTGYHTTKEITLDDEDAIIIPNDKTDDKNVKNIYLIWKWVDNDAIDTQIGNLVSSTNNKYHLTLSFTYEKTNNHCVITPGP